MREFVRLFGVAAAVGLVAGGVVAVVAHVTGHSVRPWLSCVLTVTAALVLAALYESWHRVFGAEPQAPPPPAPVVLTDRKRGGLDLTVRVIERAMVDPDRFEILRVRLVRLTEERLRTIRGVDVRTEPDRARALVGEDLVGLRDGRRAHPPRRAELDEWMTRLENL